MTAGMIGGSGRPLGVLVALVLGLVPAAALPAAAAVECPSAPSLRFSRDVGPVAENIQVSGAGWIPGATVSAIVETERAGASFRGSADDPMVSSAGTWTVDFAAWYGTPPGRYEFHAAQNVDGCHLSVSRTFTVTG